MLDLRAPGYVIGLLVAVLGGSMILPMLADIVFNHGNWRAFATSGFVTVLAGGLVAIACRGRRGGGLSIQQTFLLTVLGWFVLPFFGALPFVFGEPGSSYTDAYFEAMSGLTTTGSTVFSGLDGMPRGTLLWRGLLQWFGGVGIIVVALAFLPALKVGGMQLFRSEGFETMGKILPRAGEIAMSISGVYVGLTLMCTVAYAAAGMSLFDAAVHAMTTLSTGGFANYDASIGHFPPAIEYLASIFMVLASLPFVRLVQATAGSLQPLARDPQTRGFMAVIVVVVAVVAVWRVAAADAELEPTFREALFNVISILSGTGYASVDYDNWGPFAMAVFFLIGLIGGCAGSTCCSAKIFRYQIMLAAVGSQIRRIHSPHGVFTPRYAGRPVSDEVIGSVMSFFFMFFFSLAVVSIALGLMGYDTVTAVSGAATALANVGPGLGETIGPAGNFASLDDAAKWLLAMTMLIGRLELVSVYVLFTAAFWRG